jgi:Ulp1 family protease
LLQQRSQQAAFHSVFAIDTGVYYLMVRDGDFTKVKLRNVDLFTYDLLVTPVNLNGVHWTLVVRINY